MIQQDEDFLFQKKSKRNWIGRKGVWWRKDVNSGSFNKEKRRTMLHIRCGASPCAGSGSGSQAVEIADEETYVRDVFPTRYDGYHQTMNNGCLYSIEDSYDIPRESII